MILSGWEVTETYPINRVAKRKARNKPTRKKERIEKAPLTRGVTGEEHQKLGWGLVCPGKGKAKGDFFGILGGKSVHARRRRVQKGKGEKPWLVGGCET